MANRNSKISGNFLTNLFLFLFVLFANVAIADSYIFRNIREPDEVIVSFYLFFFVGSSRNIKELDKANYKASFTSGFSNNIRKLDDVIIGLYLFLIAKKKKMLS